MYKDAFLSVLGLRFLCLGYCGQFHELGTEVTRSMQALVSVRWHRGDTAEWLNKTPSGSMFQITGRASGVIILAALAQVYRAIAGC